MTTKYNSPLLTLSSIVVGALFLASPLVSSHLDPNNYEGGRSHNEMDRAQRNTSAVANILGELRTSASDMMFVKTERYLHNGIGYQPHLDYDAMSSTGEIQTMKEHQQEVKEQDSGEKHEPDPDDTGVPTLVPTAQKDFRGIVGNLEREVQPWQDPKIPHVHTSGTELLPWYRMMTITDPHYVRAYMIGSWWLKGVDPGQGLKFAEEGIQNNPDAFQLPYIEGEILIQIAQNLKVKDGVKEDDPKLQKILKRATNSFTHGAELISKTRPPDFDYEKDEQTEAWSNYEEEDARATARMAVLMQERIGNDATALKLANRYIKLFNGDPILERRKSMLENKAEDGELTNKIKLIPTLNLPEVPTN